MWLRLLVQLLPFLIYGQSSNKISLSPSNVIDFFGLMTSHPPKNLLDEQSLAGDPLNGNGGICYTYYMSSASNEWYPSVYPSMPGPQAVIDLSTIYDITNICLFINFASNFDILWKFTKENPFENPVVYSQTTSINYTFGSNSWHCINYTSSLSSRFISLEIMSPPSSSLLEIVVYGNKANKEQEYKYKHKKSTLQPTIMDFLMGTNGFGWTPEYANTSGIIGTMREYQDWQFTEGGQNTNYPGYPNNENSFECSAQGNFCLDDDYAMQRKYNLNWHECLMNTPNWFHNYNTSRSNWKPVTDNIYFTEDATITPSSYVAYGDHLWQVTARYGRQKYPNSSLKLYPNEEYWTSPPQPVVSGLDTLDWIELWNEPNCWWTNRQEWFSAIEVSVMQSLGYDGHCNSVKTENLDYIVGVKSADNTMKVSVGALANDSTILDRWNTMYWYSKQYRTDTTNCYTQFPGEALNVHFYAQDEYGKHGISPEDYNVYGNLLKLSLWRDTYVPNAELWVTEYGYDSNSGSPYGAPSIGNYNSYQVQGQWIMRTILSFSAVQDSSGGIQRAHQFMFNDVGDSSSSGAYATSGLVDINYNPKVSYYYFATMYNTLINALFISRDCSNNNGNVCIQLYNYSNNNNKYCYVIWCPTSNAQVINNYQLNINVSISNNEATLITPTNGLIYGNKTIISISNNIATVNVYELPQFIVVQA